ncbi:unnamed protein product [Paramecium pentaurelia]|uniref:Transmembrane protein n=1 Tax=Paramecium pentaurelia TaxID=43138 RepID=A0A8S1S6M1_9CILI|nr:unnamed protein product [Paramecium pentaurelia]
MAIGSLSLYVLSFIILLTDAFTSGNVSNLLSFFPYEVISKTQIWRLFPSFLFTSIQSFLLSFIFTQNLFAERERAQGTALFLIELIIKTFIIDSIITLFYYIEMNTYVICYIHPSNGLWNMFFYMSTIKCYLKPLQETNLFFFDLKIINKFIPFIMNIIFILFIDPVSPIVSTSLGLLDAFITQGSPCRFNFIFKIEEYLCCLLKNKSNFIRNNQATYSQDTIEILKLDLDTIANNLIYHQQQISVNKGIELPQTQQQISNVDIMLAYSQQQQEGL